MNVHAGIAVSHAVDPVRAYVRLVKKKSKLSWERLAEQIGVSHSTLSRAAQEGNPPPNFRLSTLRKLAAAGNEPLPKEVRDMIAGFEEPETEPYNGPKERSLTPDQSIWQVYTNALSSAGLLPGHRYILDTSLTSPNDHDLVAATLIDWQTGAAETILRIYYNKFLYLPSFFIDRSEALHVDNSRVMIKGTIIEWWWSKPAS